MEYKAVLVDLGVGLYSTENGISDFYPESRATLEKLLFENGDFMAIGGSKYGLCSFKIDALDDMIDCVAYVHNEDIDYMIYKILHEEFDNDDFVVPIDLSKQVLDYIINNYNYTQDFVLETEKTYIMSRMANVEDIQNTLDKAYEECKEEVDATIKKLRKIIKDYVKKIQYENE